MQTQGSAQVCMGPAELFPCVFLPRFLPSSPPHCVQPCSLVLFQDLISKDSPSVKRAYFYLLVCLKFAKIEGTLMRPDFSHWKFPERFCKDCKNVILAWRLRMSCIMLKREPAPPSLWPERTKAYFSLTLRACICQGSQGKQPIICPNIYYEELIHTLTKDEKSSGLLFADWRPRKADDVIESESEGLRTKGAYGINPSLRKGEDEMRCPSSHSEAGKKRDKFLLSLPFALFWSQRIERCLPTLG